MTGRSRFVEPGPEPLVGEKYKFEYGRSKPMDVSLIALVTHCFINEPHLADEEKRGLINFILAFSNFSHPLAKRSLRYHSSYSRDRPMVLQYHLRHIAPVRLGKTVLPPLEGLVLERQMASIAYREKDDEEPGKEQYFEERVLSVAFHVYNVAGGFRLLTLGDCGVKLPVAPGKSMFLGDKRKIEIDPSASGKGAGLAHFLVAMSWLLETWYQGWDDTLTTIDKIISFDVSSQCAGKYQPSLYVILLHYKTILIL